MSFNPLYFDESFSVGAPPPPSAGAQRGGKREWPSGPQPIYRDVTGTITLQGTILQNIETSLDIIGTRLISTDTKLGISGSALMRTGITKDINGTLLEKIESQLNLKGTSLHKTGTSVWYGDRIREIATGLIELLDDPDNLDEMDDVDILRTLDKIIKELDLI